MSGKAATGTARASDVRIGDDAIEIELRQWKVVDIEPDPFGLMARDRIVVIGPDGQRHIRLRMNLSRKRNTEHRFHVGHAVRVVDLEGQDYGRGLVISVDCSLSVPRYGVELGPGDVREFMESRLRPAADL